jgi:hypothetical protein
MYKMNALCKSRFFFTWLSLSYSMLTAAKHQFTSMACALYSAFADKPERKCHFPAAGWNCMTYRQTLQDFPDMSSVSLYKKHKINLTLSGKMC